MILENKNTNQIKYTLLKDIQEQGEYNFYGIIYDASFPKISEKSEKSQQSSINFECSIKLIDQNINSLEYPDSTEFNNNIKTLIIKSNYKEQIPFIHTIGDIIRVQHGYCKQKMNKCLYLNFSHNFNKKNGIQNWCIFSGLTPMDTKNFNINNTSNRPMLSSKKYFSYTDEDANIIKELRLFIKNKLSLPKSIFFFKETTLDKRLLNKENDTMVQVIYKTELNDKFVYYIQDDTDLCELHTYKYFDFIQINDVIRVRNYNLSEKNILNTNQFSNILLIPKTLGYCNEFLDKIKNGKINSLKKTENQNEKKLLGKKVNRYSITKKEDSNSAKYYKEINDINANDNTNEKIYKYKSILLSEIIEEEKLKNNFLNFEEDKKLILTVIQKDIDYNHINKSELSQKNNKLNEYEIKEVQIIKYHPQNLINCVKYLCSNCKKSYNLEENCEIDPNKKIYCSNCKIDIYPNFYYQMIFECIENPKSDKILILHLCTYDGDGESFFGIMPTNFNLAKEQKDKLENFLDNIIKSKGYIKVRVNKRNFVNKNQTNVIYRIVGNYTNKI